MAKKPYKDPRGAHVRLYLDVLDSHAWKVLSISARVIYVEFRAKLGVTNNGDLACTLSHTNKRCTIKSQTTLAAALFELRAVGFIKVTRQGVVRAGSKVATLYRFTDAPFGQFTKEGGFTFGPGKATFDFAQFKSIEEAQAALESGTARLHGEAAERNRNSRKQKKSTLQKTDHDAPDFVTAQPIDAPDFEPEHPAVSPKSGVLLQLRSGVDSEDRPAPKRDIVAAAESA